MKFLIIPFLIAVVFLKTSSAQKIELINSGELIKHAAMLYDSGKYKDGLLELNKVSRSDTNYVWSIYEKAIDCEADSQFSQAIKYCEEGLSLKEQREYGPDIYNTYGNTLNDMGQADKAVKVFDSAIARYPAYSLLYFNKGIVLMALKRPGDAELWFQKALLINPYMYSAHYQLGLVALQQGKIIPAFLCFIGYLLANPEGKYMSMSIKMLDEISKSTDDILEFKNKRTVAPDENYQAVEDIVLSKIALDKAYKPIISLDDAISRQIQAVFEKLEYRETNSDFYIQYYLPYYKQVFSGGKFELFINHSFANVKIPIIQDYNKKNKKALEGFVNDAADYFNLIRSTRELFYRKRDTVTERYIIEQNKLLGKGAVINNGKTLTGHWEFYYPAGNLKGLGNYNSTGGREGDWTYYFQSGKLKAKEGYKNGKQEGLQEYYFENGNPSSIENYMNDKPEGLVTSYYYTGNVKSTVNYKLGKKDGEEKEFYANGNLQSTNNYTAGTLTGPSHEYYKSGGIKSIGQYNNGKTDGPYKSYYESGAVSGEGQLNKDNAEGEWKFYYENGKVKEKRSYIANAEEGLHEEYFENGQLSDTYIAKKGKINGEATYFDEDGKFFSKYIYENNTIKSVKFFDKSGAQISASDGYDIVRYTPDGHKKSHAQYDKKGNQQGVDSLFYASGSIRETDEYKDDQPNGLSVSYYLNGTKKSELNMTNGKEDGLYTSYYVNGKPESSGWIVDGDNQGQWEYYDELGRLTARSNFLNGDLNGFKEEYLPNGKKKTEQKLYLGWLEKLVQYDPAGNIIEQDSFPKGSGKYTLRYPNKQIMAQCNYVKGDFDGPYKTYYFDGSTESSYFYKKGILDSTFTSYYYGGVKEYTGRYKYGNKWGTWTLYDEDGKLYSTTVYANDMMNGEKTFYFPSGNKELVSVYKDDLLNGFNDKYDPDGTLAYRVNFENDYAKTYTYLGKDSKLLQQIPLDSKNGVVKTYFPDGKPSRECVYKDGKKCGTDVTYYDNGQVKSIDTAMYGIAEGLSKEYSKEGKLRSLYQYVIDNANGICREYNEKGMLKKEMTYENGISNGPTKYYDENGKLIKTLTYYYGTLISATNEK